jgi:hypothetical protein
MESTRVTRKRANPDVVVQPKLTVGRSDDPAEREADRVADRVVRTLSSTPSVATVEGGRAQRSAVVSSPDDGASTPVASIRRAMRSGGSGGDAIDAGTASRIQRARGGGRSLDPGVREPMESAFGADLGDVRIHTDQAADTLNRQLDARAFTTGSDVFFGKGEFAPGTSSGRHLLAHELAHTFQQNGAQPIRRALALNNTKWSDAKSMSATTGSATGVFFLKDKAGKTLVVKGAHGTARLEMAGEIMEAAGGEAVPQRMISLSSKEGKKLVSVMKSLAKKAAPDPTTGQNEVLPKFNTQIAGGGFDAVQVMEAYQNLGNVQDLAESGDLAQTIPMMVKHGFFRQLGRMHAADIFMGNEDRVGREGFGGAALKNIFFNSKTGQAVGLDMELNAHSFAQVTGDIREDGDDGLVGANAPSLQGSESLDFVTFCILGSASKKQFQPAKGAAKAGNMGMRGGEQFVPGQAGATDPAKAGQLFDALIQGILAEANSKGNATAAALATYDWSVSKRQFVEGVAQGLKNLVDKGGDLAASADAKVAKGGPQAMFDPDVFRVRAMYARLKQIGFTDDAEIIDQLTVYVDMLRNGQSDAAFLRLMRQAYLQTHGTGAKAKPVVMPGLPARPGRPGRRVPAKTG